MIKANLTFAPIEKGVSIPLIFSIAYKARTVTKSAARFKSEE